MTKIKTDDVGTAAGIVVVSRTTDGCFFQRWSRRFGVLGCRQRRCDIDECHFLVCHSSVVASVFAPDARVITAKSFQPMMSLRCPTAARPVLDVEHVDGLADGNESRKKGSSEDVRSNPLSSDTFASTLRRRYSLLVHFFDGSCKTSRRDRPFHPQVSPLQVIARRMELVPFMHRPAL